MDEKLLAYEATRERLLMRLVELRAEQKRINWVGGAAILAAVSARFFGLGPMIVVGIFGACLFFVGHYVVFMHIHESKLTLSQVRNVIGELRDQPREAANRRAFST